MIGTSSSVQKIVLRATDAAVSSGTYKLSLDGQETGCIAYNAAASVIQTALNNLVNVENDVIVKATAIPANEYGFPFEYTVYFKGEYPSGEWPTLRKVDHAFGKNFANTGCAAWDATSSDHTLTVLPILEETGCSGGVSETQTIVIDGSSALSGTFDLHYGGEVVSAIPVSSTALQMEVSIQQFSAITNVEVSKHAHNDKTYGVAWVITFASVDGDLEMMQISDVKVIGTDASANIYHMVNITTFSDEADDISGDFRVHFNGEVSEPISYRATNLKVTQTLEKMNSVAKVAVIGSDSDAVGFSGDSQLLADAKFRASRGVKFSEYSNGQTVMSMGDLTTSVAIGDSVTIGSCSEFATIANMTFEHDPQINVHDWYGANSKDVGFIKNHVFNFTSAAGGPIVTFDGNTAVSGGKIDVGASAYASMNTGDAVLYSFGNPQATGADTVIGNLVDDKIYWVIKSSGSEIQLAEKHSEAVAESPTAIAITAGAGTDHSLSDVNKLADLGVTTLVLSSPFTATCVQPYESDQSGLYDAFIGKNVVSKKALPGLVTIMAEYNIKNSYPSSTDASLKPLVVLDDGAVLGLSLSISDKISIEGVQYTIADINAVVNGNSCGADCLTLNTVFTGTTVTNGDVTVPVYAETVTAYTTADLTSVLSLAKVGSATVETGGIGFASADTTTITFSAPPAGGTTATGSVVVTDVTETIIPSLLDLANDYIGVKTIFNQVQTGDAVVWVEGTGTITGLVTSTTYYVIKDEAQPWTISPAGVTRIRLADSKANALLGNQITLTAGGGGDSATDHVLKVQKISGITITSAGSGYTSAPTISISTSGSGTGFTATASLANDYVWVGEDKLAVQSVTSTSVALKGIVGYDNIGARMFNEGNGAEYGIVMKAYTGDLDTFRVVPEGNWRGKNARIHLTRPQGKPANNYVIGVPSEMQTLALRDTADATAGLGVTGQIESITLNAGGSNYHTTPPVVTIGAPDLAGGVQATATAVVSGAGAITSFTMTEKGSGYTSVPTVSISGGSNDASGTASTPSTSNQFKLTFNGETTATIPYGSPSAFVESSLKALSSVDQVTVERSGNGLTAAWNYGYIYTIAFWGVYPQGDIAALSSSIPNSDAGFSIHHDSIRSGIANAAYTSQYVALEEQGTYAVRVTAKNAEGFGFPSEVRTTSTANYGSLPSKPTSVVLGKYYTENSLSLSYLPPINDGGAEVTKYKVEWDTSSSFDPSSAYYGSDEVAIVQEVQEVSLYFRGGDAVVPRSGTFTLSWGGQTTADLDWDIVATDLEDALAILTSTNHIAGTPVKVTRRTFGNGYKWKITFKGISGNIGELLVNDEKIVGDDAYMSVSEITPGVADLYPSQYTYEVQTIHTYAPTAISGTFKLSFEGLETGDISFDASWQDIKGALDDLGTIHTVNVARSELSSSMNMYAWTVTFTHLKDENVQGAGDISMIKVISSLAPATTVKATVFENVKGTNPLSYKISGVTAGQTYYARAAAYNSLGYGQTSAVSSSIPRGQPEPPASVAASISSGTSVDLAWNTVGNSNGDAVDGYQVEWYSAENAHCVQKLTTASIDGIVEVQKVRTSADTQSLNGYFTLTFGGETTELISVTEAADGPNSFEVKLSKLSTIGTISVARDYSWDLVTGVTAAINGGNTANTITATGCTSNDCNNEFNLNQIIKVGEETFKISNIAGTSITLTAVDGSSLNLMGATVTAANIYTWAYGYEWTITYTSHVGDQPLIVATGADNWSGVNPTIQAYTLVDGEAPISGTFSLSYGGESTVPLIHDASATDVKNALQALSTIGTVDVNRFVSNNGHDYLITFLTELGPLSLVEVDDSELTGPSAKGQVNTLVNGVSPTNYGSKTVAGGSTLQTTVTGLSKGVAYYYRVRSYNSEGLGDYVLAAPAPLSPKTPPAQVASVGIFPMSDTAIKVTFTKPSDEGGAPITRYRVQWDLASSFANIATSGFQHDIVVTDSTQTQFCYNIAVPSASASVPRYVRVLAYNDYDWSTPSSSTPASVAAQLLAPGSVQTIAVASTSSSGMQVTWEAPSASVCQYGGDGGSPITQYIIEWDVNSDFNSPASSVEVSSSLTSYVIGGRDVFSGLESGDLDSGGTYYVRMSAVNAVGAGPVSSSTPSAITLSDTAAQSPASGGATVSSSTSVTAAWDTPSFDGGDSIDYYLVEYGTDSNFGHTSFVKADIVNEVQAITVEANSVVIEEQAITATVAVTNERQTVRTVVNGVDEIQTITTTADEVINEVQTITTTASDTNEVQTITPYATDIDEIQLIRTHGVDIPEVQVVEVAASRISEVQDIVFTFTEVNITASVGAAGSAANAAPCTLNNACSWVEDEIRGDFALAFDFDQCGDISGGDNINFCQLGATDDGKGTIACSPSGGAPGADTSTVGTNCNTARIKATIKSGEADANTSEDPTNGGCVSCVAKQLAGIADDAGTTGFMTHSSDPASGPISVSRSGKVTQMGGCNWDTATSKFVCTGQYEVTYKVTFLGNNLRGNVPKLTVPWENVYLYRQPSDPAMGDHTSTYVTNDKCDKNEQASGYASTYTNAGNICTIPQASVVVNDDIVGNQPDGTIKLQYECESKTSALTSVITAGTSSLTVATISDAAIDETAGSVTANEMTISSALYTALKTGDRVKYTAGSTAITGPTDGQTYFAVKSTTNNKMGLATSAANAFAGTLDALTANAGGVSDTVIEILPPSVGDWIRIGGLTSSCSDFGTCDEYAQVDAITGTSSPYTVTATGVVSKAANTYTDVEYGHFFNDYANGKADPNRNGVSTYCATARIIETAAITVTYDSDVTANGEFTNKLEGVDSIATSGITVTRTPITASHASLVGFWYKVTFTKASGSVNDLVCVSNTILTKTSGDAGATSSCTVQPTTTGAPTRVYGSLLYGTFLLHTSFPHEFEGTPSAANSPALRYNMEADNMVAGLELSRSIHPVTKSTLVTFDAANDIDSVNNEIAVTSAQYASFSTGDSVYYEENGGTVAELTDTTIYWVIKSGTADRISLAGTYQDATAASPIKIAFAGGSTGTAHTLSSTEKVWGEVAVTRSAYTPSTHGRWTGGYTWTITFLTRGGNIPAMTATETNLLQPQDPSPPNPVSTILVGDEDSSARMPDTFNGGADAANPASWALDPLSGVAVDGNQVGGSYGLSWAGTSYLAGAPFTSSDSAFSVQDSGTHQALSGSAFATAFGAAFLGGDATKVTVVRSASPTNQAMGYTYTITYDHEDVGGNIPDLSETTTNLKPSSGSGITFVESTPGTNLQGTFQLRFNGQTTGPLPYNAAASEVQSQLNQLSSIKPSEVIVSRSSGAIRTGESKGPTGTQVEGYVWSITFASNTWKNPTVTHDDSYLPSASGNAVHNWKGAAAT